MTYLYPMGWNAAISAYGSSDRSQLYPNASKELKPTKGNPGDPKAEGQAQAGGVRGAAKSSTEDTLELSPEAQKEIQKLKARDTEVKAHEAAHMAAGGGLVRGGASYSYERGPDGQMYAVGGEVSLDASEVPDDPAATLAKAQRLKGAALAPASPSPQDRVVAAQAGAMAAKASAELAKQRQEEAVGGGEKTQKIGGFSAMA